MEVGMFQTPYSEPERTPADVFEWAVAQAVAAEKAGFSEYWVGEHATLMWEAIPSPELVIAAAARVTSKIKLVDHCIKAIIVRTECLQYFPNNLVALVVVKSLLWSHARRNYNWKNYITKFFIAVFWFTHYTTNRLHHIYL